ncbi:hypothetical protein N781_02480 [Pontibacillus halophilus JSM 076056 = DSM 19796]|uniref:Uncharacterized protein n=1 Tax=Pontibacillus halophilus JSM 076056 = DSM 19796 TaxID=1385510 RepID=A0A0A5GFQ0_9BACI|nr:DUF5677 domain-containing protein [Pontibacillus halophilus]KGX92056.1 hypothetical protein N781_02480 [Pontibacillus halophilus JSM 076056 = DSM 19796]
MEAHSEELTKILHEFVDLSESYILTLPEISAKDGGYEEFCNFAFTKGTKTLKSSNVLLTNALLQDVVTLSRSIFENYLSSRYLQDHPEDSHQFIQTPIGVAFHYYLVEEERVVDREGKIVGKVVPPHLLRNGKDKRYFYSFYNFLCKYSHCNFSTLDDYVHGNHFTLTKQSHPLFIQLILLFCFTKLYEVTLFREPHKEVSQAYTSILETSLKVQQTLLKQFEIGCSKVSSPFLIFQTKEMKRMLKAMRKSLSEPLSDMNKDFLHELEEHQ